MKSKWNLNSMEKAKKLECYRTEIHCSPLEFSDLSVTSKHLANLMTSVTVSSEHLYDRFRKTYLVCMNKG